MDTIPHKINDGKERIAKFQKQLIIEFRAKNGLGVGVIFLKRLSLSLPIFRSIEIER